MTADTIADPRSPRSTVRRKGPNLEKAGWIYMRISGMFLVILIFGHLFFNLMLGDGIRPCTPLKPCDSFRKYAGVFDEQPMPESFATVCGGIERSQNAWTMAAVIESCPHPAQSVVIVPS
jgi:hypothetical protein